MLLTEAVTGVAALAFFVVLARHVRGTGTDVDIAARSRA
jgi:hypothetical protein